MDGMLFLHLFQLPVFTFGIRFRHREKMRGGLAVSSSRRSGRALGMVKELERRVEALDEAMQAGVGVFTLPRHN